MLTLIILRLLTLVGAARSAPYNAAAHNADSTDVRDEAVSAPRVAQVRLAETLASADAIHSITASGAKITFAITRGDRAVAVIATTNAAHEVTALTITGSTVAASDNGGLSWLSDELDAAAAVTTLAPDDDGAITLTTADGRRYMVIPGRGSGGNAGAAARWAGEWNR